MAVDPSARVASTARIAEGAVIGAGVEIGDFCVIEPDVTIGPGCRLEPYVFIKRWTTLGANNEISAGTVLGTDPLDKNFRGDRSYLRLGDGNKIREHYTISRGTEAESETVIGDRNYIMTSGHIAHNCRIGNDVVVASCALLAGYVEVGDGAFISGGVVVHQFSKIGELAMIGGNTRVNKDAPPYFRYSEFNITPRGVNIVGLGRAGFTSAEILEIKRAYRILFRSGGSVEQAVERMEAELSGPHVERLIRFIRGSQRGICRRNRAESKS